MDGSNAGGPATEAPLGAESEAGPSSQCEIARAVADVVAAHLANNKMEPNDILEFCRKVASALTGHGSQTEPVAGPTAMGRLSPAIDPEKSVQQDYIVCLEDGVRRKMLQRYLRVKYRMTPEQYRRRWNLPDDYPMVAPGHSQRRAKIALETGFASNGARPPATASH